MITSMIDVHSIQGLNITIVLFYIKKKKCSEAKYNDYSHFYRAPLDRKIALFREKKKKISTECLFFTLHCNNIFCNFY